MEIVASNKEFKPLGSILEAGLVSKILAVTEAQPCLQQHQS
jgi:hypothetical protein